uniref:Uncharacterized protein n=1 Tax=Cyprinus carpio TaxID=7962 RepID=A0A8C2B887_CYPCA
MQCVCIIHINHLIYFYFQGVGTDPHMALVLPSDAKHAKEKKKSSMAGLSEEEEQLSIRIGRAGVHSGKLFFTDPQSALTLTQPAFI